MYRTLLLSEGGGLTGGIQKSLQNKEAAVVIGIGGTGVKTLDLLKKKVCEQLQPDDPDSDVPAYHTISFLGIDAEPASYLQQNSCLDPVTEYIELTRQLPAPLPAVLKDPRFRWMEAEDIHIPEHLSGSCGIRQLGRCMLICSAETIYRRILGAVRKVTEYRASRRLTVYLLAGLAGGTGGGGFLDLCYIVREVLRNMGVDQGSKIQGYFFLPDGISAIREASGQELWVRSCYRNGYAALKELDDLMNGRTRQSCFRQQYKEFSIDTERQPVDICFLISDKEGDTEKNRKDIPMHAVADAVLYELIRWDTEGWGRSFLPARAKLDMMHMHQKFPGGIYVVLGMAKAVVPRVPIATYLWACLYEKILTGWRRSPSEQEVTDFALHAMGLEIAGLKRRLSQGIQPMEIPEPPVELVKGMTDPHVHAEAILHPMGIWLARQEGIVEQRVQELSAEPESGYPCNTCDDSLNGLLYQRLYELALDPSCGPYYAARILHGEGTDLKKILEGLQVEAERLMEEAKKYTRFQEEQAEDAKQNLILSRKNLFRPRAVEKAYIEYRAAIEGWYRRKLDVILYNWIAELVSRLQVEMEAIYRQYFVRLQNVLDGLGMAARKNLEDLAAGKNVQQGGDPSAVPVITFDEIKPQLDAVLGQKDVRQAAKRLVYVLYQMPEQLKDWQWREEPWIAKIMNQWIDEQFGEVLSESPQKYLAYRYPDLPPQKRIRKMKEDIFQPLQEHSSPLFRFALWADPEKDIFHSCELVYPMAAPDISTVVSDLRGSVDPIACLGVLNPDQFFMQRLYIGIPLSAYADLQKMKTCYDEGSKVGVHLYGKGEEIGENLPDPMNEAENPSSPLG